MGTKSSKGGQDLLSMALEQTIVNTVKARGTSGRKTYLDRFVDTLLEEDGKTPTEPKERVRVIAEISLGICQEKRQQEQIADPSLPDFTLTVDRDTEDDEFFAETNKKVKAQVAAAIANNNNSTSVSYNEKYKDVWQVVKTGSKVSLAPVDNSDLQD